MKIALDIMGGDYAPQSIIEGAFLLAESYPEDEFVLVGLPSVLKDLSEIPYNVHSLKCGSVMAMDEDVRNLMTKKDSSIWIATELVKNGETDAIISAGSTGAQMTAATLLLSRIKGCERPAIASVLPTLTGGKLFLDVDANVNCSPSMLFSFAKMGVVYAEQLLNFSHPRVVLLTNGTEEHKGNKLIRETFNLLKESKLNFQGNNEGRDILVGEYEVMVCDGMSGNIAIKSIEGAISIMMTLLKKELMSSLKAKFGAALIRNNLLNIKKALDQDELGGAPLLGIKGISIVCHGGSHAKAIFSGGKIAHKCYENNFVKKLENAL